MHLVSIALINDMHVTSQYGVHSGYTHRVAEILPALAKTHLSSAEVGTFGQIFHLLLQLDLLGFFVEEDI